MTELLATLAQLSVLVFVMGSMASMGLSLKISQIMAPLKNVKLVLAALVANFVLVPLVAFLITKIIPLDEPVQIGLILLSAAAKGSTAFSVA